MQVKSGISRTSLLKLMLVVQLINPHPAFAQSHTDGFLTFNFGPNFLLAAAIMLLVAIYAFTWFRFPNEMPDRQLSEKWEPAEGLSPGVMRYILNHGLIKSEWKAITASLISLAIKGCVRITKKENRFSVQLTDKEFGASEFSADEHILLRQISGFPDQSMEVASSNGDLIGFLHREYFRAIEENFRASFFLKNNLVTLTGVGLSAMIVIWAANLLGITHENPSTFAPAAIFLIAIALYYARKMYRNLTSRRTFFEAGGKKSRTYGVLFLAIIVSVIFALRDSYSPIDFTILVGCITLVNLWFYFALQAPTPLGRIMINHFSGLKKYLDGAGDRLEEQEPDPDKFNQRYEQVLPFAIALGEAENWTREFEQWQTGSQGTNSPLEVPSWFHEEKEDEASQGQNAQKFWLELELAFEQAVATNFLKV